MNKKKKFFLNLKFNLALGLNIKIIPFSFFITLMDKNRTARSHRHHIDHPMPSDCSQQDDNLQSECYHRNNHNSGLIQHDELIKSTSEIVPRKRRVIPYHHRSRSLSSSTLLILIRLMILVIFSLIVYYIFLYIYPKPKQNGWERILDWFMGE